MDVEKEVVSDKGRIKILELKLKALINILQKEGIATHEEIDAELNDLVDEETNKN